MSSGPRGMASRGLGAASPAQPTITLRGMRIHALTGDECVRYLLDALDAGRGGWIATPNVDHLRRVERDPSFAALCAGADLAVPDGMPLVWASRLQDTPLPERVPGSDLVWRVSAAAAKRGRSVFLLGGAPGTAEGAASVLQTHYPKLRVAGTHCPAPGFEGDEQAGARLVDALRVAGPDIVYVALGSPKQERLIERYREMLPRAWWLPVGISFSYVTGAVRRTPRWMRQTGLEWLHRLAQEPRRLVRRYVVDDMPFTLALLGGAALGRAATVWRGRKGGGS
jgi:N-acetylglucosaminyldiphosphoundecaprenol N-acetyl-beta-D-mannosaminyltransferase